MPHPSENRIDVLWSRLHWLSVLSQQGSYTAAAARLGVSKAAMSQHLAELERVAGVALVRRTTRSVQLTDAGQRLVDETRAPFEQIAQTFSRVRDLAAEPRGRLRITAPVAFSRQQLVLRLADFLRAYPQVRLELDMSDRLSSMATEGFDLAIRHSASAPDTHVAWTLCPTRSVLVASRGYLRRKGVPKSPEELEAHDCLHYPRAHDSPVWTFNEIESPEAGGRGASRPISRPVRQIVVPVSGPFSANNSEALRDAALGGLGIALLPDFSAQASLLAGKLVTVLPNWKPIGVYAEQLFAIRPYSAHVPRAVTAFVTYLREAFAEGFSGEMRRD